MEIAICFPNGEDLDSQSSPFSIQKATIIQIHEYFREFSWVKPPQRLVFIMQMFYKWMKMKWLRVVGLLDSVLNTCKLYLCSCFSSLVGLSFDSLAFLEWKLSSKNSTTNKTCIFTCWAIDFITLLSSGILQISFHTHQILHHVFSSRSYVFMSIFFISL
jgi:hypothetical protein